MITFITAYLGVGFVGALANAYTLRYQGSDYTRNQKIQQFFSLVFLWPVVSYLCIVHKDQQWS